MHGKALVFAIIIVVLASFAGLFVYSRVGAQAGWPPKLEAPPKGEKQCVESKEYMRRHHVDLLIQWRDRRVREGALKYIASDGKEYTMSLSQTCLGCHSNKAQFCDRCHDQMGVQPPCFDCHVQAEKGEAAR